MSQKPRYGPGVRICAVLAAMFVVSVTAPPGLAGDISNDVCATCHEEVSESFHNTAHGVYFNGRPALTDYGCESCHGSGARHIEDPSPDNIINPAKSDQFSSSVLCLNCHQTEQFDNWHFASHNTDDVNCASCHSVHGAYDKTTARKSPELCYDCHSDMRSYERMPSHHPIAEGKINCTDCHNPHGGSVDLVQDFQTRELCFSCHPNVEGPYVYEHAPVSENCMICHNPHGSVANNLLVQNEPVLCLNCHAMHFHATVEGVDGEFSVPVIPGRTGTSSPDAWKSGMLTKCTQCHTAVHGSDLPSQAISSGGNALTR